MQVGSRQSGQEDSTQGQVCLIKFMITSEGYGPPECERGSNGRATRPQPCPRPAGRSRTSSHPPTRTPTSSVSQNSSAECSTSMRFGGPLHAVVSRIRMAVPKIPLVQPHQPHSHFSALANPCHSVRCTPQKARDRVRRLPPRLTTMRRCNGDSGLAATPLRNCGAERRSSWKVAGTEKALYAPAEEGLERYKDPNITTGQCLTSCSDSNLQSIRYY
jgi:hypothetical protein